MNIKRLRFKVDTYFLFVGILFILTILSGVCLVSNITSATSSNTSEDNVAITIPVACTLVSSGNNSHSAAIVNGTYTTDIGTTTLKVTCNDNQGFAIYAVGYTGNEIGATNSTKLVGTAASSNTTIDTGTATGPVNNNDNSNWAMKLNTTTSPTPVYPITLDNSFNSYSAVPSSYTKVAHRDSGTDIGTSAVGSTLTTTYAAYISKLQYPDTYTGQVKYTLVHPASEVPLQPQPAVAGYIVYHANASDAVGTMGNQSATDGSSVTLYASNFSRTGYGFAGWSDAYDYATNPNANFYGPNQTITVPTGTTANGLSLYAVWIKSAGSLQSDATTACNGLTEDPNDGTADLSSVTALTDERDNNTYAIAKLADGKCWMIENLRLDDSAELSSTNTHNPSLPITNVYDATNPTTSNHLSATTDPTTTAWCISNSSACDDQSMLATNNTTLFTDNTSTNYSTSSNVYSYGNYYNWYSATAGHGKYGSSYASGYVAPGDICPAGWHLPTGNTSGEFSALDVAMGGTGASQSTTEASNRWRTYPNNFVYSGTVNGSSVSNRSSNGYYWSASGRNTYSAYYMNFSSSRVYPGTNYDYKYYGRLVWCLSGA